MRITCIIHSLAGGGAERLMAGLASRLADRHEVTLLTLDDATSDRYAIDRRVTRIALGVMAHSRNLWAAIRNNRRRVTRLRQAVGATRPDVVLSFCDKNNVLALVACGPLAVPVVVSEHTDPRHQIIGRIWSLLRRRYYRHAAASIALTDATANYIARWTGRKPAVIPPAVDPVAQPEQRSPGDGFRWLAVGRLSREKAFERAIDAFARLAAEFPDWSISIAGEGPEREHLQRRIDHRGLADRVHLLGWVDDMAALRATCDAFVLTSHYEGFPVSLLEAMAAGLACVAVDCESGPGEVLRNRENGLLVPQDDPEALRLAMQQVMRDAELRSRVGSEAVKVAADYGWPAFVEAHERVLREASEQTTV